LPDIPRWNRTPFIAWYFPIVQVQPAFPPIFAEPVSKWRKTARLEGLSPIFAQEEGMGARNWRDYRTRLDDNRAENLLTSSTGVFATPSIPQNK
jgi:hypothetical protein